MPLPLTEPLLATSEWPDTPAGRRQFEDQLEERRGDEARENRSMPLRQRWCFREDAFKEPFSPRCVIGSKTITPTRERRKNHPRRTPATGLHVGAPDFAELVFS
jgi:hypothetical protein